MWNLICCCAASNPPRRGRRARTPGVFSLSFGGSPERPLGFLSLPLEFVLKLLLARKVELVAARMYLLIVFGKCDLDHRVVLVRAEHDAYGWRLVLLPLVSVEVIDVHLHLTEILMRQLRELEIDQHEASEQAVVEDQVHVEVIATKGDALLPSHETEAFSEFQHEGFESVDDGLFEISLEPSALVRIDPLVLARTDPPAESSANG